VTSLRASIATLQRYSPEATLNISDVAKFLLLERPFSINILVDNIELIPESVPFHSTIVTGAALGGEVTVTLGRDGSHRFSGFMRATGALSFSFRVGAVIQSATGQVALVASHSGKVFGTDTPGERQHNWDKVIFDPKKTRSIRELWPDISDGTMTVNHSSTLSGVLDAATEIVKDVGQFFLAAETLGVSLTICLVLASELGDVGVDVPGLGGVVGIGIIAGSLFIWGPLAIGPAFVLGVAAGALTVALIKMRRMRPEEEEFSRQVFGEHSLDFGRIRITNLVGIGGVAFTLPTVDDHILINIGVSDAMFDAPINTTIKGYGTPGQLLIHELTHAWQIQHGTFVPGWLCTGIDEQVLIGKSAYNYGPAGADWDSMHNEAQAHIVDEWYAGTGKQKPAKPLPPGVSPLMNPESDYFSYIENNIRVPLP
jgi:hypothetical protein